MLKGRLDCRGEFGGRAGHHAVMAVVFGTFSLVSNARLSRVLVGVLVGGVLIGAGLFVPTTWMA